MGNFVRLRAGGSARRLGPGRAAVYAALVLGLAGAPVEAQGIFIRGDSNRDGTVDISDPTHTLSFLFLNGPPPGCEAAADSNDDDAIDLGDPIKTLFALFLSGETIPIPWPSVGLDPTPGSLGCLESYPGLLLEIRLAPGFDQGPITGLDLIFDSAPGGPPLDLTPPGGGEILMPAMGMSSDDRDAELEIIYHISNPTFPGDRLQVFLPLDGVPTQPASLQADLLWTGGILASAVAYQLPDGGEILLAPDTRIDLSLLLSCQVAACQGGSNHPPAIDVADLLKIRAGKSLSYPIAASDPDGDSVTVTVTGLSSLPGTPQFVAATRVFSWTPPVTAVRDDPYVLGLIAMDPAGVSTSKPLRIQVVDGNSSPVWSPVGPQTAAEGRRLSLSITPIDPDGDDLEIFLDPSGLPEATDAAYSTTHIFSWTPTFEDARPAPYTVSLLARDDAGGQSIVTFPVTVLDVSRPPILSLPSELTILVGATTMIPFSAVDPDGDLVTVAIVPCDPSPSFPVEVVPGASQLRIQPGPNDAGSYCIRLQATDQALPPQSTTEEVSLVVSTLSSAPVLDPIAPRTVAEGQRLTFAVHVTPAAPPTVLSLDKKFLPPGNDAVLQGGEFSWTPAAGTARDIPYGVTLVATGSTGLATSLDVSILVGPGGRIPPPPPVQFRVTEAPASTTAGIAFRVAAELRDGFDHLTESVTLTASAAVASGPAGASLGGTVVRPVVGGVARFDDLTLTRAGTYRLAVAITPEDGSGTLTAETGAFVNGPGPATAIVFRPDPINATAGQIIAPPVQVELRDAFANFATSAVTMTAVHLDSFSLGASLSGTLEVQSSGGVATFDDLVISKGGSGFTLRVTASGLSDAVSAPFTVAPAAVDLQVAALTVPPGALSGAIPVTFTLRDSTADPCSIAVEYRLTPASPFIRVTQAGSPPGSGFHGVEGLATSPSGESHVFLWNSSADLHRSTAGVSLRVTPFRPDGTVGLEDELTGLTLANGASFATQAQMTSPTPSFILSGDWNLDGRLDLVVGNRGPGTLSFFLQNPDGIFLNSPPIAVAAGPSAAAAADIFRQGSASLAVTSEPTDQVVLVFNSGGTFFADTQVAVGDGPTDIVLEDFNRDHKLDFATANAGAGTVSVSTQNPLFVFSAAQTFPAGAGARSIATGDFNRDAFPDLATANRDAGTVSVLLGNPALPGSFLPTLSFTTGSGPVRVATADIDGDGKLDLLSANTAGNSVSYFRGQGNGNFFPRVDIPLNAGFAPATIFVGDFDKDRRRDIAIGSSVAPQVRLLTQDPASPGTFLDSGTSSLPTIPVSLVGADLNRDGRLDLAVATLQGVTILRNTLPHSPEVVFAAPLSVRVGDGDIKLAVGDVNGDGKPDVVTGGGSQSFYNMAFGTGSGALEFGTSVPTATATTATSFALAPLDSDSRIDLVTGNSDSGTIVIWTQAGSVPGTFTESSTVEAPGPATRLVLAPLNGDHFVDLLAASESTGTVSSFIGTGTASMSHIADVPVGATPSDLAVGDFNRDGIPDLVVTLRAPGAAQVLAGDGSGGFSPLGPPITIGIGPAAVAAADVDVDGQLDFVVAVEGAGTVTFHRGNGSGGFTPAPGSPFAAGDAPVSVAVGDLDGDARPEVVVGNRGSNDIRVFHNAGATLDSPRIYRVGLAPESIALSDMNGDGFQDVVVLNSDPGTVWTLTNNGLGGFFSLPDLGAGNQPAASVVVDLNRDGYSDLVVSQKSSNTLQAFLGDGLGGFTPTVAQPVGIAPVQVAAGDLDRDGKLDVVTANFGSSDVSILTSNTTGALGPELRITAGPGAASVALADLNHDSDLDLVTANSLGNTLTVRFGSSGAGFGSAATLSAGLAPGFVLVDDTNRDGCLDLIAINEGSASAMVYINRSDGTFFPPQVFSTGPGPRMALATDLEGNGTKDLVVANSLGVAILPASGHGTFGVPIQIPFADEVLSVQVTGNFLDANDDGRCDLGVVGRDSTTVLLNEGELETFTQGSDYGTTVLVDQPVGGEEIGFDRVDLDIDGQGIVTPRPRDPVRTSSGGCAIGRFEYLGGPALQRLAALLTVGIPLAIIALLKRRARREWERRPAPPA